MAPPENENLIFHHLTSRRNLTLAQWKYFWLEVLSIMVMGIVLIQAQINLNLMVDKKIHFGGILLALLDVFIAACVIMAMSRSERSYSEIACYLTVHIVMTWTIALVLNLPLYQASFALPNWQQFTATTSSGFLAVLIWMFAEMAKLGCANAQHTEKISSQIVVAMMDVTEFFYIDTPSAVLYAGTCINMLNKCIFAMIIVRLAIVTFVGMFTIVSLQDQPSQRNCNFKLRVFYFTVFLSCLMSFFVRLFVAYCCKTISSFLPVFLMGLSSAMKDLLRRRYVHISNE